MTFSPDPAEGAASARGSSGSPSTRAQMSATSAALPVKSQDVV